MGGVSEHPENEADPTPEPQPEPSPEPSPEQSPDRSGSRQARMAWSASGITFFLVGVVFTLTMPDNIALGITFLAVGVVFFSLAGTQRAPGDGPGAASGTGSGDEQA